MPSNRASGQHSKENERNLKFAGSAPTQAAIDGVSTMNTDDLDAARRGSPEAFARLFNRLAPFVLAVCRSKFPPGAADPDDALQETFIRAFGMLDRLDQPDRIQAWLLGIARNVCAERCRAASRRTFHERQAGNHDGHLLASSPASDGSDPARIEMLTQLEDALNRLPETLRLVIHLHYLETDPVKAAVSLGITRSTYYKRLVQARRRLAAMLDGVLTP